MWIELLVALVCQFGMTWSQHLEPSDLGRSTNVYNPFVFNDYSITVIWNKHVNDQVWLKSLTEVFKKNFETSYDTKPQFERSVEVCENLDKLIETYFRDIKIDHVASNHFSSFWTQDGIAERFGISKQYATKDYSYVLVKTSVIQHDAKITSALGKLDFKDEVRIDLVPLDLINNVDGVFDFVKKYGTHFISSYATGGLLYQVFVYNKKSFHDVDEALPTRVVPIGGVESLDESQKKFFSPGYATEVGRILSADANSTVEQWAEKVTKQSEQNQPLFNNLLKLHDNSTALEEFKNLAKNDVLVKLKMSSNVNLISHDLLRESFFDSLNKLYPNKQNLNIKV